MYCPKMNIVRMTMLEALSLTDVEILSHYYSNLMKLPDFMSQCVEYEKKHDCSIARLNNGEIGRAHV